MVKKFFKFGITMTILAMLLLLPSIPCAYSLEESNQQKVSAFLENVVGLDMANYEAKLISDTALPNDASDAIRENMLYNLNAQGSTLEVICNFRNNEFVSCSINPIKGSIILANPTKEDALTSAKTFLNRYQAYSNAPYMQSLKVTLIRLPN